MRGVIVPAVPDFRPILRIAVVLIASLIGPRSALALDFHVDAKTGDDTRSAIAAQSAATPWATIGRALRAVTSGHRIVVHPGTYPEAVETRAANVSLVSATEHAAVISPPAGLTGITVQHDGVTVDGFVVRSTLQGVLVAKPSSATIRDVVIANLVVEPPASGAMATNGIHARDAENVLVESCLVRDATQQGILLKRVGGGYVRNNVVYGQDNDWAISIDGDSPNRHAPTRNNLIAFNTVWRNARGIRMRNASGEIRDNVLLQNEMVGVKYDQPDALLAVHHNAVSGSALPFDLPSGVRQHPTNLEVDPGLVAPELGNFALRQLSGEGAPSPLLNLGSGSTTALDIGGSTASDGRLDEGIADPGFHAGAPPSRGRPPVVPPRDPELGAVHHVDCALGDDTRSRLQARNPSTPWRSLQRAASQVVATQIVVVRPGICPEGLETRTAGVTFRAETAGTVVLEPMASVLGVNVQHDDVVVEGFVVRTSGPGVLAAKSKAGDVLRGVILRGLRVERIPGAGAAGNGIQVRDAEGATIENSVVVGAGQQGILLKRVSRGYVRNNLVYGQLNDWGIAIDGDSPNRNRVAEGNVVAFNTIYGNLNGLRLRNASGEVHDNIIAANTLVGLRYDQPDVGWAVHHNDSWGNGVNWELPAGTTPAASNVSVNPRFVDPAAANFALRQLSGEGARSPLIDRGSGPVEDAGMDGSTASDGRLDVGTVDMGFHSHSGAAVAIPDPALPPEEEIGAVFHVDCASGDDARTVTQARNPATPWRTIGRGLAAVAPTQVLEVAPGLCAENVRTVSGRITLRAREPGTTVIAPPGPGAAVKILHDGVTVEGFVLRSSGRGLVAKAASGVIRRTVVRDVRIEDAAGMPPAIGIAAVRAIQLTIESSVVGKVRMHGISARRSSRVYLRNNLVLAEGDGWGIFLNGAAPSAFSSPVANLIAFNTVSRTARGIRSRNARAEIRDNVVHLAADTGLFYDKPDAASAVHHNAVWGSARPYHFPKAGTRAADAVARNLVVDPGFVAPHAGNFALRQVSGEGATSPLVDAGSGPAATSDIDGSTASDGRADVGRADIGHHARANASALPPGGRGSIVGDDADDVDSELPPGDEPHLFVDCASGNDSRSREEVRDASTPWRSLARAGAAATNGDVVLVKPGTCTGGTETRAAGVEFRAATPGSVVIETPVGVNGFEVKHDDVVIDGFVIRSGQQGILGAKPKDGEILRRLVLRNLVVEPPPGGTIATNGIQVRDADDVLIESCVVRGARQQGIVLKRVNRAYVRNNLVHDQPNDWGISIDGDSPNRHAPSVEGIIAFNTVWRNKRGIRMRNAIGEIRDNIAAENEQTGIKYDQPDALRAVHHNDAYGSSVDYDLPSGITPHASNLSLDPGLLAPHASDFALRQLAGETPPSPLVDRGSGPVAERDISGSTASDGQPDVGIADIGFHAGADDSTSRPEPLLPVDPEVGAVHYVDCTTGDDARTKLEARNPATPWRTLRKAALTTVPTQVVIVRPGVCRESFETQHGGVSFVAPAGPAVIEPAPGQVGVTVQHDDVLVDGFVVRSSRAGVVAAKSKAGDVLRDLVLRNLRVEPPAGGAIATNGIQVRDAERVTVENSVVTGALQQGILLKRVSRGYVRNNLVHGQKNDWGISIDGDSPNRYAPATENIAAFNTVYGNQSGLRFRNASGEIRDNIVSENALVGIKYDQPDAGWAVHHNDSWGSATAYDLPSGVFPATSNLSINPRFVDAPGGRFQLRQVAGEGARSQLLDAGSGPVEEVDISGSTASNGRADKGIADLGYHFDADGSGSSPGGDGPVVDPGEGPPPLPQPGSGATYFVDPAAGDDGRSSGSAQDQSGAWRTLARAINAAAPGDVVTLLPGTYTEEADFKRDAVTLRGAGSLGDVVITPPFGKAGINVDGLKNIRIENLTVQDAAQGIVARNVSGLRVTGVALVESFSNGIAVTDASEVWIESSIVTGSGDMGVKIVRTETLYVRNNLVYANADWGISIDGSAASGEPARPPARGNVVAFNTVHGNRSGVRLLHASGEVRDNSITSQVDVGLYLAAPDVTVHHNNWYDNGRNRDQKNDFLDVIALWANISQIPRYQDPAGADGVLGGDSWRDDDFRLRQRLAGDGAQSALVDAGSGTTEALDIDGSTAATGTADTGIADIGFHYDASGASFVPTPMPIGTNLQSTFYVSASDGDDSRSRQSALRRSSPWRTISHALQKVAEGDTIVVLGGTYRETAQIKTRGVQLLAEAPGTAVLEPTSGNGVTVEAPNVTVDGLVVVGGATGIAALAGADAVTVRNCAAILSNTDGFRATDVTQAVVEHSIFATSGNSGLRFRRATAVTVNNVLSYDSDEWGIAVDNTGSGRPLSTGNVIANVTLAKNFLGNLMLRNASGEVRDSLIVESPGRGLRIDAPGVVLIANGIRGNAMDVDPPSYVLECTACRRNLPLRPRFVRPGGNDGIRGGAGWADDDFRLADGAGGGPVSEAIDAGSTLAEALGLFGTTSTSGALDEGLVDLGFHYGTSSRALPAPPPPNP